MCSLKLFLAKSQGKIRKRWAGGPGGGEVSGSGTSFSKVKCVTECDRWGWGTKKQVMFGHFFIDSPLLYFLITFLNKKITHNMMVICGTWKSGRSHISTFYSDKKMFNFA